ncbi:MAG TPA: hypothetical protein VN256_08305 [Pyrinomonadaceae bacterium]|nr:hypothetical protein [Pyrinomonadaceae bacterium]
MQEGRWTKIGGFFTVIGTIVAIVAFFSGDKKTGTTRDEDNSTPEVKGSTPEVRDSRSPSQIPGFTAPGKPLGSSADLNGDGLPEGLIRRCYQQPPICEFEVYDAKRNRTLGVLVGDEVSAILPSKTGGYYDIAVLRKKDLSGRPLEGGKIFVYKWDGEGYSQAE